MPSVRHFPVHLQRARQSFLASRPRDRSSLRAGKFLNALRPKSSRENENLDVVMVDVEGIAGGGHGRKFRIRQITGQFARRIVCWVRPGDVLGRGEMYGMIKLGSRTELIIPTHPSLEIIAAVGDKVCAGSSVLARYRPLIRNLKITNLTLRTTADERTEAGPAPQTECCRRGVIDDSDTPLSTREGRRRPSG